MKYFAAIAFVLSLTLPTQLSAAPDQPSLSASVLKSLLVGNSMAGNGKVKDPTAPYDWISFYAADNTLTIRLKPEWGGTTDTGKWWITEKGELCRQFLKMGSGKKGCWLFYQEDEFFRFIPSQGATFEGRAAIIKGNLLKPTD